MSEFTDRTGDALLAYLPTHEVRELAQKLYQATATKMLCNAMLSIEGKTKVGLVCELPDRHNGHHLSHTNAGEQLSWIEAIK